MLRWFLWLSMILGIAACAPAAPPTPQPLAAQDFALMALDGSTVRLSDLRGRWVMINFWATDCDSCRIELADLQRIAALFADRLTMLGVNVGSSDADVRAFAADMGLQIPVLLNPDQPTLDAYYVTALPVTVIIAPDGNLVYRQFGPVDMEFESELAALLGA